MKTNKELKKQAEELFQSVRAIERYTSLIRSMDNNLYEISCYGDAINADHPKSETIKQAIEDLVNLNEILLEGFGRLNRHAEIIGFTLFELFKFFAEIFAAFRFPVRHIQAVKSFLRDLNGSDF